VFLNYISAVTTVGARGFHQPSEKCILCTRNTGSSSKHINFQRLSRPVHSQCLLNIVVITIFVSISTFHVQYTLTISVSFVVVFQECYFFCTYLAVVTDSELIIKE
jgi:hypothetical protein